MNWACPQCGKEMEVLFNIPSCDCIGRNTPPPTKKKFAPIQLFSKVEAMALLQDASQFEKTPKGHKIVGYRYHGNCDIANIDIYVAMCKYHNRGVIFLNKSYDVDGKRIDFLPLCGIYIEGDNRISNSVQTYNHYYNEKYGCDGFVPSRFMK